MIDINIKKIKPMFNQVICTMDKYTDDDLKQGGLVDVKKIQNPIKEYQRVVAVGNMVRDINVGDLVMINPTRYGKTKHGPNSLRADIEGDNPIVEYKFNIMELDHVPHLILTNQDIDFVIEEYEKEAPTSDIIEVKNEIIL